jgi:phosphoglycolate phosphatase-like HAD superfamily hydrolase
MASSAVILDVDGTLVDSNDAHARAWVDAFAAEGVTVAFDRVRRAIGMGGDKLMPAVSGIEKDSPEGQRISDRRARIFKERELPGIRAFPGVHALAERLVDDGYVLSVASSAKDDELRPLLERAGVLHLIAANASSDDAEHSKPDPDIVVAAFKAAGVDASRAIMIGDTPYDVAAAGRAGIQIIALECGGWRREELNGAIAVYADPAHLLSRYGSSPLAALASRTQTRA